MSVLECSGAVSGMAEMRHASLGKAAASGLLGIWAFKLRMITVFTLLASTKTEVHLVLAARRNYSMIMKNLEVPLMLGRRTPAPILHLMQNRQRHGGSSFGNNTH